MASVVQITGDPDFVRGPIRPVQFVQNEFQGGMLPERQATAAAPGAHGDLRVA